MKLELEWMRAWKLGDHFVVEERAPDAYYVWERGQCWHRKGQQRSTQRRFRTRSGAIGAAERVYRANHKAMLAQMFARTEPRTTDYCRRCGESPESATHLFDGHPARPIAHPSTHAYVDPRL